MADPLYSAGARFERKAMREAIARWMKAVPEEPLYRAILKWIKARESRYSKKPGGL